MMNTMNAMLSDADLMAVNGGETIDIDGVRVLCKRYTVRKGDTLLKLARRFNTTVRAIMLCNKNVKNPNRIYIGQILRIPVNYKR